MLLLRVTLLLCYSSVASAQFGSQEGTLTRLASELRPAESNTSILSQLVLVIGAVRSDRIYLMERYAFFFHSVIYMVEKEKLAECQGLGVTCVCCDDYNCKLPL